MGSNANFLCLYISFIFIPCYFLSSDFRAGKVLHVVFLQFFAFYYSFLHEIQIVTRNLEKWQLFIFTTCLRSSNTSSNKSNQRFLMSGWPNFSTPAPSGVRRPLEVIYIKLTRFPGLHPIRIYMVIGLHFHN